MDDCHIIGRALFTDGTLRDVFQTAEGWQFVQGDDGEPNAGQWLAPPDEPYIMDGDQA